MARTELFSQLKRLKATADFCEQQSLPSDEGIEIARTLSRRDILKGAATLAGATLLGPIASAVGRQGGPQPRIAIVGGGLSGLAAADRLRARGIAATIYEASDRVGGRCKSLRGFFPGQVAELGGEFIDTPHKTMLSYANEFGLTLEDVNKEPGAVRYFFGGQAYTEAEVIEQFRVLTRRMQPDLRASSGAPTAFDSNAADVQLDALDIRTYLQMRASDLPLIRAVLEEAYLAEYGLEANEQSSLNLLLFIKLSRNSKFKIFGTSDERYHVVQGNDAMASGIAARLPGPIVTGRRLEALRRTPAGAYELKFAGISTPVVADYVILTVPFSVLRNVALDASLGLSNGKRNAIQQLGYGMNAKTMVGFQGEPWLENQGSNGTAYADLAEVQTTWQTNPSLARATSILTDYASGDRGRTLNNRSVTQQVAAWLNDLDRVFPGSRASATRVGSGYRAVREHWPSNPLSLGSYTCYRPGQFTGLAGYEGEAAGALKFGGEHADSFYSWQGFMEGALLSGIRAANEVLADL